MIEETWAWATLVLLGAYHGINPGMGWLLAVALGMQEKSRKAVWRALLPITLGHALAIGSVVALATLFQTILSVDTLKIAVAIILLGFGVYRLVRSRHPRWGGMQVGFTDLTIWSFLMASAHGAGLMVLPVLLEMSPETQPEHAHHSQAHLLAGAVQTSWTNLLATGVHTLGYLLITGLVAMLVYEKLGLALLRKAWLNLDLIWGIALIITGLLTLAL